MLFTIQLNWSNKEIDLDLSAFLLAEDKWIPSQKELVYYHNDKSSDGSVWRSTDDRGTGIGETLWIDTAKISDVIQEIFVIITIHQENDKKKTFSSAGDAKLSLTDDTGKQYINTPLHQSFANQTALEVVRIYNRFGKWRVEDIQVGYQADLAHFVNKFVY